MRPPAKRQSALRAPLNDMLGTEANVRILRVLSGTENPLSPSILAKRAMLAISGIAKAVSALEELGIVEYVGVGTRRLVRFRAEHPLADAVRALFRAERARFDAVIDELKRAARQVEPLPLSVWVQGPLVAGRDRLGDPVVVGLLGGARELDRAVSSLEAALDDVERKLDVSIEVRGRTTADLAAGTPEERKVLRDVLPLLGPPPLAVADRGPTAGKGRAARRRTFSHAELDARARALAAAVAERIRTDPGIVERARAYVITRLADAPPGEQRELREWERILRTMTGPRLRRFLVDEGERATRLRQTSPFIGVLSPEERERLIAEHSGADRPAGRG